MKGPRNQDWPDLKAWLRKIIIYMVINYFNKKIVIN